MTENSKQMQALISGLAATARVAQQQLGQSSGSQRNTALLAAADRLEADHAALTEANAADLEAARNSGLEPAFLDRLALDSKRIAAMAGGLRDIAALEDPLNAELARWQRPNGLDIQRISTPLGVIGIIYESRPNVTVDAAGLCIKSGNAAILRGGSDSRHSAGRLAAIMRAGLSDAGLDEDAVQMVPTVDRAAVGAMLAASEAIDVIVPRGGRSLVERIQREARVPVFAHLEGICHLYIHPAADSAMAVAVTVNAKMRRTGICGAAETVLIDAACADNMVPRLAAALTDAGCRIRGCQQSRALFPAMETAAEADWGREYLDSIIAMRVVEDQQAAIAHIRRYGSSHTESIITEDAAAAEAFITAIDSAIVMVNTSTQFADGGEFGMGAEIGIATGRLHARGPVGAAQLTSFKYIVRGSGQTRP